MHAIYFSPATSELFLVDAPTTEATAAPSLFSRLRALGWPARARLVSPKAPQPAGAVSGVLVELIDALPLLAQTPSGDADGAAFAWVPALAAWQAAAQLALQLTRRGHLGIAMATHGYGWEARWHAHLQTSDERAALLRAAADFPVAWAVPEEAIRAARMRGGAATERATLPMAMSGQRLLQRFLNACADTLVRESGRRGAVVRLKDWPATSWEQRLVRALGEDRARFFFDPAEASPLCAEINAWAEDHLAAPTLSLLPSPGKWQAPESLASVMQRLLQPAGRLAETLLGGQAAPRTLRPVSRLSLAA